MLLPFSVYLDDLETMDCPVRWRRGLCGNVLFVNKQIHREASGILYKENVFSLYIRHPMKARLPMNESRPDDDSFVLFSWTGRHWAHPKNSRSHLRNLSKHPNFPDICKLYVSAPELDGLIGVDACECQFAF